MVANTVDIHTTFEALPTLEALLQENAELKAENVTLRAETVEYGLAETFNNGIVSGDPQTAAMLRARLETLKHEHDSLCGMMKLGDELQELHNANTRLREEAGQLQQENPNLRQQNAVLRARSKTTSLQGGPGES